MVGMDNFITGSPDNLTHIAGLEKVTIDPPALYAIARGAEGAMRDAESTLDQLISFCGDKIEEPDVLSMFGLTAQGQLLELSRAVLAGEVEKAVEVRVRTLKGELEQKIAGLTGERDALNTRLTAIQIDQAVVTEATLTASSSALLSVAACRQVHTSSFRLLNLPGFARRSASMNGARRWASSYESSATTRLVVPSASNSFTDATTESPVGRAKRRSAVTPFAGPSVSMKQRMPRHVSARIRMAEATASPRSTVNTGITHSCTLSPPCV